jgi:chromosome segregation ATPase
MASEIASVNAELVTTRARLQAAEQRVAETAHQAFEREAESSGLRADVRELQTELDMVRQAVASDVAEISALADDGVAAQTELENLRMELQGALTDRDGAVGQLEMVRAERDQLTASLDGARRELSVAHADIEQQRAVVDSLEGTVRAAEQSTAELQAALALATEQQLANDDARQVAEQVAAELAMTQGQRAELEAALSAGTERMVLLQGQLAELEAARETLASESEAVKAQLAIERDRVIASESERQQLLSELEAAHTALGEAAGVRAELDIVSAEKLESENAWAQEQQKVASLEASLGESQAAHLDSETRLQGELSALQQKVAELEAVAAVVVEVQDRLKEAERHAALEEARADRAVADATGMRQYIEAQTHEQARIVGEIEQLRPIASEVDRARAAMVDMQRQLEAALGTDELDGSTEGAIEEGARARTRELLELARAIEPFVWGLDQAAGFFAEANVDGATRHIQAMRLLQKTLERLKNELDRLHQT